METLAQRIGRGKAALLAAGPRLALLYAQTILALVTLRVQSDGLVGKAYSAKLISTSWFSDKTLNATGKAYIKDNKKGTWGGLRAAQGLPATLVNLTYSGRMFRSLTIAPASMQGAVFFAKIVAADQESAQKVGYNVRRYGNFLLPTAAEKAEALAAVQVEINRIMKQVFTA